MCFNESYLLNKHGRIKKLPKFNEPVKNKRIKINSQI